MVSLTALFLFFLPAQGDCQTILETRDFILSLNTYFRTDLVTFKNVLDLNSHNKDGKTVYLGLDYSLGFLLKLKESSPEFFLKLERNGPYDYDAPIFVHNTLMTSAGVIEKYRGDELLPQVEEFWLDVPMPKAMGFKAGLYLYEVGNGFALNGSYENYGATFYRKTEDYLGRIYYCRPDLVYKKHLGPRIRQEEEQGVGYEHNAANFFAVDTKFNLGKNTLQPYAGVLADYTSFGKRSSLFTASIHRDILGTFGLSWKYQDEPFVLKTEAAHNFGRAESISPEYKDIYHTGYLFYGGAEYALGKFTPSLQLLLCSGNKVTPEMAENQDITLTSGKNRAFSYYSPLNINLGDSISSSNVDMLPIVAMGGGWGLNYGIPRPGTFCAGDFENLIMPCIGSDYQATDKLCLGVYLYYLMSFERGVGMLDGKGRYLSRDLGQEVDVFIDYQLNKNILLSILGGYFFPGRYYKERRDDTEGSLFSPYLRGDGKADCAYQLELALEIKF